MDKKNCHLEVPGMALVSQVWPQSKQQQIFFSEIL